jgi:hypothetical protein
MVYRSRGGVALIRRINVQTIEPIPHEKADKTNDE